MIIGSQVTVTLYDQNRQFPLVVDFDSIDYKLVTKKKETFRTIGKTQDTNNIIYGGFDITLTRVKNDVLLDNFVHDLFKLQKSNYNFHELIITKKTNMNYSTESIDLEEYYNADFMNESDYNYSAKKRKMDFLENQANFITRGNANPLLDGLDRTAQNMFGDYYKNGKEFLNNVINLGTQLKGFMDIDKVYKAPLRQFEVFYGCTLSDFGGSDRPNEESVQTITFTATGVENFDDENLFNVWTKKFLLSSVLKNFQTDINEYEKTIGEDKIETKFIKLNNYQANLIRNLD